MASVMNSIRPTCSGVTNSCCSTPAMAVIAKPMSLNESGKRSSYVIQRLGGSDQPCLNDGESLPDGGRRERELLVYLAASTQDRPEKLFG